MKKTLAYCPHVDPPFCFQYGPSAKQYTMIGVWNLGVKERVIQAALLNPNAPVNIEERPS